MDIPSSKLWELDDLHAQAMAAQERNRLIYDEIERALGEIARRHYPHIAGWQPEDLRRLADRISRAACDFCTELEGMEFRAGMDAE